METNGRLDNLLGKFWQLQFKKNPTRLALTFKEQATNDKKFLPPFETAGKGSIAPKLAK